MHRHIAREIERSAGSGDAADKVVLDYESRFLRRKTLTTAAGESVFVDLPETVSLNAGDVLITTEGARIEVEAAEEPLIEVTAAGAILARLAWHIGNRHTPAQIEAGRILIQTNHVMADMLARMGAEVRRVSEPFTPEGGAYGLGRTHGHYEGGATDDPHDHSHD